MPSTTADKQRRVLLASAEIVPFAKEGGLADVAGALPKALAEVGVDIRAVMPLYGGIDRDKFGIKSLESIPPLEIPMGPDTETAAVYATKIPGSDVPVYMIANGRFFDRKGVYNDPETGEGYSDNAFRFIFFQKAVIELLRHLNWTPEVIHCNDFHTGLIPYYVRSRRGELRELEATLFSIHNLAYQGVVPLEIMPVAEIPLEKFYPMSPFEFYGKVNMMKVGIVYATLINTVSPTYAREIQSDAEFGAGLEGVLRSRASDLSGIINGIDYSVWNPEIDSLIPHQFSAADLKGKELNKQELLKHYNLPQRKGRVPLIGIISRLADQKGFDILEESLDRLMEQDIQMVVLGTGVRKYHELFEAAAAKYPEKLGVSLAFDNALAHLIEAGSDMFLMPSRYEPCGLNQLYSLRYGTIPVVRATGGLADTIADYNPESGRGTGFSFKEYSGHALFGAVQRAVRLFADGKSWKALIGNAMTADFSWKSSAEKYLKLYNRAVLETAR
ncbi:MAG TPA: glycogen synthase GlgA [Acidobacteriota bacterium]|nr:glycogen synthase GlgA [Acidobacteriota bacterium]